MKLIDLKYLKSLEETRSFTQTAKLFRVSQPVVSLSVQRLEKEVKKKIVLREKFKDNIEITSIGKELIEYFEKIDREIEDLKKIFKFKNDKFIHIGINNSEIALIEEKKISEISKKYLEDGKNLVVFNEEEECLRKYLLEKYIKVKLSIFEEMQNKDKNSNIEKKFIRKLDFSIIKSKNYKISISNLNDLNYCTVIALNNNFQTEKMNKLFSKNNIIPNDIIYVKSLELAQILIEEGMGVGLFMSELFDEDNNIEKINIFEEFYLYLEHLKNKDVDSIIDFEYIL